MENALKSMGWCCLLLVMVLVEGHIVSGQSSCESEVTPTTDDCSFFDPDRKCVCPQVDQSVITLDMLDLVLKQFIDKNNNNFGAKDQEGETCYANAVAAVLHLTMKRIMFRDGGYPDFISLRDEIIDKYGKHGASVVEVLKDVCPRYRLQYEILDVQGALYAVANNRPVIANFWLTVKEWDQFKAFFTETPRGILTESYNNVKERWWKRCWHRLRPKDPEGHAVVLISFDQESLRLMNSWSPDWGDEGFFHVKNAHVLDFEFIDVFYTSDDLSEQEKEHYKKAKSKISSPTFCTQCGSMSRAINKWSRDKKIQKG